jgi:hypothetical protein
MQQRFIAAQLNQFDTPPRGCAGQLRDSLRNPFSREAGEGGAQRRMRVFAAFCAAEDPRPALSRARERGIRTLLAG